MFIKKSLLIFLLKIGLMSECFANEYQLITYENISSEVSFKKWGENGLGNVVDKHILTLVMAKTKKSNITVFRWNKKGSNFVSELYEFEDSDNYSTTWRMKNNNNVLTLQHNSFYMIQFKIPGEQGGVMSEIFKLPDENK